MHCGCCCFLFYFIFSRLDKAIKEQFDDEDYEGIKFLCDVIIFKSTVG